VKRVEIDVVDLVVFTVGVYVATIAVQIYQPSTGGYFNLGESIIYLAALVSTPLVAGLAGGIGASLADISTGYGIFAPGTLVIKFIEGYVAGVLIKRFKKHSIVLSLGSSTVYAILLLFISYHYWAGEIYYGPSSLFGYNVTTPSLNVSYPFWVIIIFIAIGLTIYVLLKKHALSGEAISLFLAGSIMVLGYFLYEYFISNPLQGREPIAAVAEIPVNIGQVLVGIIVSIPLASWLRRAGYVKGEVEGEDKPSGV